MTKKPKLELTWIGKDVRPNPARAGRVSLLKIRRVPAADRADTRMVLEVVL
jgi:hypothetical protein